MGLLSLCLHVCTILLLMMLPQVRVAFAADRAAGDLAGERRRVSAPSERAGQ